MLLTVLSLLLALNLHSIKKGVNVECFQMEKYEWCLRSSPACPPDTLASCWAHTLLILSFPEHRIQSIIKVSPGAIYQVPTVFYLKVVFIHIWHILSLFKLSLHYV